MLDLIVLLFTSVFNIFQVPEKSPEPPIVQADSGKIKTQKMSIGTNLNGVSDYSTQIPFIDAFKFSRQWVWEGPYSPITTNINKQGWLTSVRPPIGIPPKAKPTAVLFAAMSNSFSGGQYVVLYEGDGKLKYRIGGVKNEAMSRPGRDVIEVNPAKGPLLLQITSTDPNNKGNYIRNIRLIPTKYENISTNFYTEKNFNPSTAKVFNPDFLARIKPFITLRFMDWMRINGSNQEKWSDRPMLNDATWTIKGVPVEIMVALANQSKADPWFNMPHMANDDYVRKFAEYVKTNLAPGRKVYVEYTNEAWNLKFPQTRWIEEQSKREGIRKEQWYARRSAQMIDIWKQVFGSQSDRVIGVLGAQAANTKTAKIALDYLKSQGKLSTISVIAIAPYFGNYLGLPTYANQVEKLNLDDLFLELSKGGVVKNAQGGAAVPGGGLEQSYKWMENYMVLSRQYGIPVIAYEGGQHLAGVLGVENNQAIFNLFTSANRDPRMGELYRQYLNKWKSLGGGAFLHFNDIRTFTKWGSWGLMEHLNDVNNPKYKAVKEMAEANR